MKPKGEQSRIYIKRARSKVSELTVRTASTPLSARTADCAYEWMPVFDSSGDGAGAPVVCLLAEEARLLLAEASCICWNK